MHLAVEPDLAVGHADIYCLRIEDALKRNAEVEAKAINVTVSDGKVRLDGKVHTWAERSATVRAAWAAPGVHLVEDRIMIA